MKTLTTLAILLLATSAALAQSQDVQNQSAKAKLELQKLFSDLNEAIVKKDRATLEHIYADEFQFIHANGAVADKATQINGIMTNDPVSSTPVPAPSFDNLSLYQDVAILRGTARGVTGTNIYVKKEGRWQIFQVQGTRQPPERKPITINPQLLESFLGKYEFGPGAVATVTKEGDVLKWRGGNRLPVTLMPLSETHFFAKETSVEMMFNKNDKGQATDVVLRLGVCQDSKAKKIE